MSAACCKCDGALNVGDTAYASDWKVIDGDGVRIETRYVCEACNEGATPACCVPCAESARCDTCDDRLCAEYGPEPRACGTTCCDCPCDCPGCMAVRADLVAETVAQIEREGRS